MKKLDSEVKEILKARHEKAVKVAEQNLAIARKDERFRQLEERQGELCFEIANLIADNKDVSSLNDKLKEIKKEREKILKEIGLGEKDLVPNFTCKKCLDTGKDACKCAKKIKSLLLLKKCNLGQELEDFKEAKRTTKTFSLALDKLQQWSEKFPDVKQKSIFISGQTGTGKTFLSRCVIKKLLEREFFVLYTTAFSLNQQFLSYIKDETALEDVLGCDLLVIDDLGTEPILNNVTLNYLYLTLNERAARGRSTLINSNLGPEEILDRYGERIFSRIFNKRDGLAIKLEGEDLRLKKQEG